MYATSNIITLVQLRGTCAYLELRLITSCNMGRPARDTFGTTETKLIATRTQNLLDRTGLDGSCYVVHPPRTCSKPHGMHTLHFRSHPARDVA